MYLNIATLKLIMKKQTKFKKYEERHWDAAFFDRYRQFAKLVELVT